MDLYQIILSASGALISIMLLVIGFFLTNFYKESKKANENIMNNIDTVKGSINQLVTKVTVQDRINMQLMEKDNEIWEEMKQIIKQLNTSTEHILLIYEEQQKQIDILSGRLSNIEGQHTAYHKEKVK